MRHCTYVLCLLINSLCFAETTIYTVEIPGLHQKDSKGVYDIIIETGLSKEGLAKVRLYPPARAQIEFSNCTDCCFSPANLNPDFYDYGSDVVVTEPMGIAKVYIFSPPGVFTVSGLDALKGKKVGIRHGMPYGKSFEQAGLDTQAVITITSNIKKLKSKRIDYMVAYVPDAFDAFKLLKIEPFPYNADSPLAVHPDSMVCRGVKTSTIKVFDDYVKTLN